MVGGLGFGGLVGGLGVGVGRLGLVDGLGVGVGGLRFGGKNDFNVFFGEIATNVASVLFHIFEQGVFVGC